MSPRKRLGQLLTELKVIDEAQLQSALGHQKQWGGKIGAIVVEKGFCSEAQLVAVLSQHLGIATVKLEGSQVDPRAVKAVSRAVAERLHVFAYEVVGAGRSEVVSVAMSDPTDLSAVDQLAFHTGKRIKAMLAADSEILAAIEQHYPEGSKAKSASNVRPLAPGAGRAPTPLRVAPPIATPVEPVAKVEPPPPRPAPYIPPPVPQNAKPQPVALDEIEPELPSEGNGESAHGFDAEQERLRQEFPATDAIEAPPESEEPMTLETPTTLQGWKEGAQASGIDWQEKTGPVAANAEEPARSDAAPREWSDGADASAQEAQQAPAEWQTEDQTQPADDAPAEWQAEQPATEEAPAEWHASGEAPQEAEAAPSEWSSAEEPAASAEAAPAEWHEEETAPDEAPAEWQEAAPETSSDQGGTPVQEEAPREWSAQEPRVPEAESQDVQSEVPQDAWEDVPVEDATEAPAQWSESAENEEGEGSAFAAEAAPGSPIALPGPNEPAIAEAFAESGAAEEASPAEEPAAVAHEEPAAWTDRGDVRGAESSYEGAGSNAEESTDRFRTPTASQTLAGEASSEEPAREDQTDEWPPQEATQEEVEWAAAPEALSAADVATLGALGIDPGDGAGAMRALACLVRVLNRRQAIDVEELAAEIRESQASSAEAASSEGNPAGEGTGPFAGSRE